MCFILPQLVSIYPLLLKIPGTIKNFLIQNQKLQINNKNICLKKYCKNK
jgi:hypothetical protein